MENKADVSSILPKETIEKLVEFRKEIHRSPELSGQEFETAEKIKSYLEQLGGFEVSSVAETGVLAIKDYKESGPCVLLRADIDALPIQEINEFEHRSTNDGISHKCGHDGHTMILLGLAEQLVRKPLRSGRVILLFQPSEEDGTGSRAIIDDDTFKKLDIDHAFALHNLPGFPLHSILAKSGSFTAFVQSLIVRFTGKTAHAGEPEQGINPALAIADLLHYAEANTINIPEREDFALITPVYVSLGEKAYGISAGYGEVHLTVRTWTTEQMQQLSHTLLQFIHNLIPKYNLEIDHDWTEVFQANENDEEAVQQILGAAEHHGLTVDQREFPFKWGEDFGLFTQQFPGAMFGIGAGEETPALHNPDYDFPDEIIPTGVSMFYRILQQILD